MPVQTVIRTSHNHGNGLGVFAVKGCRKGTVIGKVLTPSGAKTTLGRYVQHDQNPNAEVIPDGKAFSLKALRSISPKEEITVDPVSAGQIAPALV